MADGTDSGGEKIALVEERLTVGKRTVAGGSVRVRSYVLETPVEEQVSLRDETVSIERRAADRPVTGADGAAFRDRTIEATETDQEAVVAKTARVTGELVMRKGRRGARGDGPRHGTAHRGGGGRRPYRSPRRGGGEEGGYRCRWRPQGRHLTGADGPWEEPLTQPLGSPSASGCQACPSPVSLLGKAASSRLTHRFAGHWWPEASW